MKLLRPHWVNAPLTDTLHSHWHTTDLSTTGSRSSAGETIEARWPNLALQAASASCQFFGSLKTLQAWCVPQSNQSVFPLIESAEKKKAKSHVYLHHRKLYIKTTSISSISQNSGRWSVSNVYLQCCTYKNTYTYISTYRLKEFVLVMRLSTILFDKSIIILITRVIWESSGMGLEGLA